MKSPAKFLALATTLVGFVASTAAEHSTFSAKILVDSTTSLCTLIKPTAETQLHRAVTSDDDVYEQKTFRQNRVSKEELLLEEAYDAQAFIEIFATSAEAVDRRITEHCPHGASSSTTATDSKRLRSLEEESPVIEKIVDSGDPKNRIDVVFMGDGYTSSEQTRFFDDIRRLTHDMFTGETFAQYLPLFNIWGVHVPSAESGIGVGGQPKDTAFGLYRDGTELRGVYASNPDRARSVCSSVGQYACDFPSLIGNDDFYGGLGGEFVISTRSETSGTVVLRHEMGHNFGRVGEEYDGGQVYSGANSAPSASAITWKHWLTNPNVLREESAAQLYQKHIWYDLQKGAYKISFTSTGKFKRWYILLSVSGADTDDSLSVTLDGKPLAWQTKGLKDRTFYSWTNSNSGFSAGSHELVIQAGGSFDSPIIKQLCNAVIYEYADESQYKLDDPNYIGIYPTFDINKRKTVRPNNEKCLMRNMTSPHFCRVCQENMWLKFMERVTFIDSVTVSGSNAEVQVIPLAQKRLPTDTFVTTNPSVASNEKYAVQWLRNGQEVTSFRDQFNVDLSKAGSSYKGKWTVRVTFTTPNVRLDPKGLLKSEKTFTV
ncbi:TPA: hypothetical protein N0F65_009336 [Lagenidium giganteum]|uniref:IgA peptidase M64-domain-containing protein n=1 Tax=Lagenidium giganteum TaxID=4803 RepID=A0AAV2YJ11_9STRA|nr:TPA: hypothetical protein N0F65_009336 [Lagenidium giganteum]